MAIAATRHWHTVGIRGFRSKLFLARAAANRRAAKADATHAVGFHAGVHAIAASLNHVAAGFVAAGAGDDATIFGHFARAIAHAHVALTHHHSILHATATTHAVTEHFAHVLESGARHVVLAHARHLHPAIAFLHFDRASRDHGHVAQRRHHGGDARHGHRASHGRHHRPIRGHLSEHRSPPFTGTAIRFILPCLAESLTIRALPDFPGRNASFAERIASRVSGRQDSSACEI